MADYFVEFFVSYLVVEMNQTVAVSGHLSQLFAQFRGYNTFAHQPTRYSFVFRGQVNQAALGQDMPAYIEDNFQGAPEVAFSGGNYNLVRNELLPIDLGQFLQFLKITL